MIDPIQIIDSLQDNPRILIAVSIILIIILKSLIPGFPLPKEGFMLFAGYIFGIWLGTLVNIIGIFLGCTFNFELAYTGRSGIDHKIERIKQYQTYFQKHGWKILIPLRVSPITFQDVTSYAAGFTKLPRFQYYLISGLVFLGYSIVFAYFGYYSRPWLF